jgi:putative flippase GtrA
MKFWRELILFGGIGTVGLLIDIAVLYALKPMLGLFFSRGVSFFAAVLTTWYLNKTITFQGKKSTLPIHRELIAYVGLMLLGGAVNYVTYIWLVTAYEYVQSNPFLAVTAGSLAGMLLNYSTSKFVIFRKNSN